MEKEKKYLLLNWILLAGYACLLLFSVYSCGYVWPTQGSIIWFLLLLFCPPFLYQLSFIGCALTQHKKPHWGKSQRLVSIFAGLLLACILLQLTQKFAFNRFKTAYNPMLAAIAQNMPQPCRSGYFAIKSVADYNASVSHKILSAQQQPEGKLFYNRDRFVLYFRAGSADMDNSTLFYDSQRKNWDFFHNSDSVKQQNLAALLKGLSVCE
jgi:hypothetical protein